MHDDENPAGAALAAISGLGLPIYMAEDDGVRLTLFAWRTLTEQEFDLVHGIDVRVRVQTVQADKSSLPPAFEQSTHEEAPRYHGLTEGAARSLALAENCPYRVAVRNGVSMALASNFRPDRINVALVDELVVAARLY